jgi:hypothetical protein
VAAALSATPGPLDARFDVAKTKGAIGHVACRSGHGRREDSRCEVAEPHNASSEHYSQDPARRGSLHPRLHALHSLEPDTRPGGPHVFEGAPPRRSSPAGQCSQKAEAALGRMVRGFGDAVIKQDAWDLDKARALPEISPILPFSRHEITRQSEHWQKAKSKSRSRPSVLRDLSAGLADRASRETFLRKGKVK